ncbi:MarR family winged helix-turn-helix transcriptional regulator [Hydrogenophaga sp. R2]|uniref:MarR family winged helix-turn-helix transcriptional regulator n=1 Tax=Hydrogenophaga sp. R2 TaxID=3132827 RepID=UPI003CF1A02B
MARTPPIDLPANRLDQQLCFALYRATNAITHTYRAPLAALGLTYPQYLVMLVLWEDGEQTVGGLAQRLALDASTLTPLLRRMETAGLVQRQRDPANQRSVRVRLTDAGQALEAPTAAIQQRVACATRLDGPTFEQLRLQLHRLAADLDAA